MTSLPLNIGADTAATAAGGVEGGIRTTGASSGANATSSAAAAAGTSYLDEAVEVVNRQIDNDINALLEAFDALVGLSIIGDKDRFRIAQESFEAEARADSMVRAAQSLTLLSHSLKLSLLLAQEPISNEEGPPTNDDRRGTSKNGHEVDEEKIASATYRHTTLDEEAVELIERTARARQRCAQSLRILCGKEPSPIATQNILSGESQQRPDSVPTDEVEMQDESG